MIGGNAQFTGAAKHAVGFDTAHLDRLDQEWLAILTRRQLGADQRAWDFDASPGIRRTTDDLQRCCRVRPYVDRTQREFVRVRMLLAGDDLADDDLGERRRSRRHLLHLQPGHRERVGEFVRRHGRVAEAAEPGFGELHKFKDERVTNKDERRRTNEEKVRRGL